MSRSSQITEAGPIARLPLPTTAQYVFLAKNPSTTAPSPAAILGVPGTGRLPGRPFIIRTSGTVFNAGAAATAAAALQFGTDTNAANNTIFASTQALAIAAGGYAPFWLEARLIIDPITGLVTGQTSGCWNGAPIAATGISATTTVTNLQAEPLFNVVGFAQISTANAASYAVIDAISLEA